MSLIMVDKNNKVHLVNTCQDSEKTNYKTQRAYFSSKEYRDFYQIARNYQTRSLNVDSCSVFFYGVLKGGE